MTTPIREEFEKAYLERIRTQSWGGPYPDPNEVALWAARWMAEYIAKHHFIDRDGCNKNSPIVILIRQLSKDLER